MFQFTPLVRGATLALPARQDQLVSIHAPRARGDVDLLVDLLNAAFQFTPLVRGATLSSAMKYASAVSIHAPRARGDGLSI